MTEAEPPKNGKEHPETAAGDKPDTVGEEPIANSSKPEPGPTETRENGKEQPDTAAGDKPDTVGEEPVANSSKPEPDPALERLRIDAERYKAKLEFRKHVIVSGFVAAAIAAIPPGFQYATAKLEEAKSAAQLHADLQTKEADRNRKQEEFREEYIKLFLDMAVDQNIGLRLRFAEYFAAVSADPSKSGWIEYRTRLENERKNVREGIDSLERERVAALLDPNKKQTDIDQIDRKLNWDYKQVGYLPLMRSVVSNPRTEPLPSKTVLSEPLTGSKGPSASDTVKGLFDALINTMNNAREHRKNFDMQWMARLSSGPFWTTLAETQQKQLIDSYGHYISALYADRFQGYAGQKLEVTGEEQRSQELVLVHSQIIKANGEPVKVDYMCRRAADSWLISDIYLDSAISEVASHRSEVVTLLKSGGIDGLIAALNRKANRLSGTVVSWASK